MEREMLCRWNKILIVDTTQRANQGLAGAACEEFGEDDAMYFLRALEDAPFDNADHGYGPVLFDMEIAFLDADGIVLKIASMEAQTGSADPPRGTKQAIEARSGWFGRWGFNEGEISPVLLKRS